jgi:hypothetical protein
LIQDYIEPIYEQFFQRTCVEYKERSKIKNRTKMKMLRKRRAWREDHGVLTGIYSN